MLRESVDDFAIRVTTVLSKMHMLGEKIEDSYVVDKVLRVMTPKYLPITTTLEQFGNLSTMSIEKVFGRLKAYEERVKV